MAISIVAVSGLFQCPTNGSYATLLNHHVGSRECPDMAVGRKIMTKGLVKCFLVATLAIAQAIAVHVVWAGEHRQHGAHEHGVAHLNVAVEGNNLVIELFSPAANIVGFEHHPKTQAQKKQVKEAREKLGAAEMLFKLPTQAQGRLVSSNVDTNIDSDSADASYHHEEAGIHDEDEQNALDHHNDEQEHSRHSDFKAQYQFFCDTPEKLAYLDVMLFQIFPGIQHIEVQILTDTGQSAKELTAKDYRITF